MQTLIDRLSALEEAIAHRRSMGLARLSDEPVERAILERMLVAANWAPSHGDTEPWRFTVFTGEGRIGLGELFAAAYAEMAGESADPQKLESNRNRALSAPVWISIGVEPMKGPDGTLLHSMEEEIMAVACAVHNMHLVACAAGLAGMWHSKGVSVHPLVAKALKLEPPAKLLGFFFCGHPKVAWPGGERRPIEEKVCWIE